MRTPPMLRRRALVLGVAAALLTAPLAACGTSSESGAEGAPAADAVEKADGVTTVTFWHSMDGKNQETLTTLVDQFNAEHKDSITVDMVYQGNYDDAITKYKAAVQSKSTPSLVQVYDIGTQFMIDAERSIPVQAFIDRDDYDTSDLQENILGYYTVNDELWSMPFNSSMPVLYYNKDLFRAAGLDPENPPTTWKGVADAAAKLSAKNGGPATVGFEAAIYGWWMEQNLAASGALYCGPDNGRSGSRADEFTFDDPASVEFLTTWRDMIDSGVAQNIGRQSVGDPAFKKDFANGTAAMALGSTGSLTSFQDQIGGAFEWGVGFFPKVADNEFGPVIGGASLWIQDAGHTDAEKQASWELLQFLASPASQATWHTGTGYFPTSKAALDEQIDKDWIAANPEFQVALDQLEATTLSPATQGCAATVMPQARQGAEEAMEKAILGGDIAATLSAAADTLTAQLSK